MFRYLLNQNFTSLYKPVGGVLRDLTRKYSNGCPCPDKPACPPCPPPSPPRDIKITICGANGQLGQIIAFLLKQSPLVNVLNLYDLDCTYGTAMDLAHIDTSCRVKSYSGCADLYEAMCDANIIIICAGVGRAPGMCLNDLFEYNAPVVKQLTEAIITVNPRALIGVLTNPINSFVPMVSQIFKNCKCYDSRKIFGITTIDTMRACTIVANDILRGTEDPGEFLVPVIGGHSPETMVPVLSQTSPCVDIPNTSYDFLIDKIRRAACMVTSLKHHGGPRLSVALGAARFINNLIRGLKNERDIIEMAYVYTNVVPGVCYFAGPIELGPHGIKHNLGLLKVDEDWEQPYLKEAIRQLKIEICRGETYIPCPPDPCAVPSWD
ncbi:hypothetical protein RUM43_009969 [Polyplax serrata]|uniref:Malate dehydrogenase, mitochondrial n=1 Tax=Polyplax serrata TaxID=468196 RepID=A0AAN8S9W5_POLSC